MVRNFKKHLVVAQGALLLSSQVALAEQKALDAWASSYLVRSVFIEEYRAVLGRPGLSEDFHNQEMSSQSTLAIWQRTHFAFTSGLVARQRFQNQERLQRRLRQHQGLLAKGLKRSDDQLLKLASKPHLHKSFDNPAHVQAWEKLAPAWETAPPKCPLGFKEVQKFSEHQSQLFASGRTPSAVSLIKPTVGWSKTKMMCLIYTMMAASDEAKKKSGFDPLPLLLALRQIGHPHFQGTEAKSILAINLLEKKRYSETLRLLIELSDKNPAYRLPYEIVQRVYSIKHTGQGVVALKGL